MILLDTYSLLSLVGAQENLTEATLKLIADSASNIFVSSASAIELGNEYNKKLIELPCQPQIWYSKALELHGLIEIPVSGSIALLATQLPQLHQDTIDRLIIATAMTEKLTIVTNNRQIQQYPNINWQW